MFATHEAQVKKYVENGLVEVRYGINTSISSS